MISECGTWLKGHMDFEVFCFIRSRDSLEFANNARMLFSGHCLFEC